MTMWILHCWAHDIPKGEEVSWHLTLDDAIYAALAWIEGDHYQVPQLRSIYSLCEIGGDYPFA